MNTHALIRATVRNILDRAESLEWSYQGLGMLRFYLSPTIRLHIWNREFRVPNVSEIHTHPWDFRSYVVAGEVRQCRLVRVDYGPMMVMEQRLRCGPGGCVQGDPQRAFLKPAAKEFYGPGRFYEQLAEEIHESFPVPGTVTLVERHFHSDTEHAQVFYSTPTWVSAEPRKATPEEVKAFVASALEIWEALS